MRSPYQRRAGLRLRWWQFILLLAGVVLIVLGWEQLNSPTGRAGRRPPAPDHAHPAGAPDQR